MTWAKISDTFNDDPALLGCSRGARLLYVEMLVWSIRQGTDGTVPAHVLPRITDEPDPAPAAGELVVAGLLEDSERGWLIVRFAKEQISSNEVETKRENTRIRQERHRKHNAGDHSMCDPKHCGNALRHALPDESPTSSSNAPLSRPDLAGPVPARPGPRSPRARNSPAAEKTPPRRCPGHNRPYSGDGEALCGACPDLEPPSLGETA